MSTITKQDIIEDIQSEKLSLSDSFTRSLDLLATGLFTRQGQFFYELLQNAEDCAARDEETNVEIVLQPDAVLFRNNGELFQEEDIRNICDVGRTQKKSIDENIGFWGIGFKSVFRVTDSPHILSNGYRFKFDREYWQDETTDNELQETPWYVTPIWVEDPPVEAKDGWNTFYMPYIDQDYRDRVVEGVDNLQSHLLLFLEKVDRIKIIDELEDDTDRSREMRVTSRSTVCDGRLVTLFSGERWWVYEETFDVPDEVSNDKITRERKRENIESRSARIAIKVDKDDNLQYLSEGSVHASVFSFLPIQGITSGMPFIIDADLLTGAGRTKPHEDAAWNDWMMKEIGSTLVPNAIGKLQNHDEWKYQFHNALLPSEKPKGRLFRRLDDSIMNSVKEMKIIPTAAGSWATPEDSIHPVGDDVELIRSVLSSDDISRLTDRELSHESVQFLTRLYSDRLPIREMGTDPSNLSSSAKNVAEVIQDTEWLKNKFESETAEWFAKLYEVLDHTREHDEELRELPLIRTADGLKRPEDVSLRFSNKTGPLLRELNLEEAFPTVDEDVLKSSSAESFLRRLNLTEVSADDLADDLIQHPEMLPAIADDEAALERFKELYTVLNDSKRTDDLSQIPIVYTGETVVKPSSETASVLLPAKSERVEELLNTVGHLLEDVDTVPDEIINPEFGGSESAKRFLRSLDIEQVGADWIAKQKLLPRITDGSRDDGEETDLSDSTLVTYTGIVNDELDAGTISDELLVLTQDGEMLPASEVYLSRSYNTAYDIESLLNVPVVSASYKNSKYGSNWRSFFENVGVQSGETAADITTALQAATSRSVDNDLKSELTDIYCLIDEATGQDIDLSEIELLTQQASFEPGSEVYLSSGDEPSRRFPSNRFAWTPNDESVHDEVVDGLQNLGLNRAAEVFTRDFSPGDPLAESVDVEAEDRIRNCWGDISENIPSLPQETPEIKWVEQIQITYHLGGNSIPATADRHSHLADGILYLARDFGHRWEDLAEVIADSAESNVVSEEIESKFVASTEEAAVSEVIRYEASKGRRARGVREDQDKHLGYDVLSREVGGDGEERHIEIKSFSKTGTAKLRPNQQERAKTDEEFYLYIVQAPQSVDPQIWFKKTPNIDEIIEKGGEFEQILTLPSTVWERYCDGPISIRHVRE